MIKHTRFADIIFSNVHNVPTQQTYGLGSKTVAINRYRFK